MPRLRAPWWLFFVAGCFLGRFVLLVYCDFRGPEPIGLLPGFSLGGLTVAVVFPGSPAARAEVRPGDQLVAADGQALRNWTDYIAFSLNVEAERPILWDLEREGRLLTVVMTLGRNSWTDWSSRMGTVQRAFRVTQLFTMLTALLIAFARPNDALARLGALVLATSAVSGAPPEGFAAAWRQLPSLPGALLWIPAANEMLLPALVFTLFARFPGGRPRAPGPLLLAWLPALAGLGARVPFEYGAVYGAKGPLGLSGPVLAVLGLTNTTYVLGAIVALVMNYRRLGAITERRRVRVLVAGSVAGWIGVVWGTYLVFAAEVSPTLLFFLLIAQAVVILMFPLSFAYAILRHRLFDIRLIVRQGLRYALARRVIVSVAPVMAAALVLDLLAHGDEPLAAVLGRRGWIYALLGGLALASHRESHGWLESLDRRFFRERYDARRLLLEVVDEVRQAESLERVAPRVVASLEAALHPEFVVLLAADPHLSDYHALASAPAGQEVATLPAESKLMDLLRLLGRPLSVSPGSLSDELPAEEVEVLRAAGIELLVPIATVPEAGEAILALGGKRSEEPYTREDRDLLMAVAGGLALVIERRVQAAPIPATAREALAECPIPAAAREALAECPRCGTCYDAGTGRCVQDGSSLVAGTLPRLLADRYLLERRLGSGGMGTVYEASDTALARLVAVKVISDDRVERAKAAERFRREARVLAAFAHPNVVRLYDFGLEVGARAFLVMEKLVGRDLAAEMRACGRMDSGRMFEILTGVCAALQAAHSRELVHRDLKPANIFLAQTETGEIPKVLDFGLAKFRPLYTGEPVSETATRGLVGTPRYMAPEQLIGGLAHPSWDLWALGVVAYEMLCDAYPFAGADPSSWQAAMREGRITPVGTHVLQAPARCQAFFEEALAAERSRRPASATAFLARLDRALR